MSFLKKDHKLSQIDFKDTLLKDKTETEGITEENCAYSVTVSKKTATQGGHSLDSTQKSFISIHSTDKLCQIANTKSQSSFDECNVEVLSLNEVFPSTSEESLSNDDDVPKSRDHRCVKQQKPPDERSQKEGNCTYYTPSNSKSTTGSARHKGSLETQTPVRSDFDIPKNTLHVVGSNPGEPKVIFSDAPKHMSKSIKKILRNKDKQKTDQCNKSNEKAISKFSATRGILKENRCGVECTGDSTIQDSEDYNAAGEILSLEMESHYHYTKQTPDRNVSFNTQVVIIHFTGDLCVGQSIETLSKEKDQQARNSELKKTFLTKYNEFWPMPGKKSQKL